MNQLQTLRGNLIRLRKYYESFYALNSEATDKAYLGFPFVRTHVATEEEKINFANFTTLLNFPIKLQNEKIAKWVYEFIVRSADNGTYHPLSILILHATIARKCEDHIVLQHLTKLILTRESFFISQLENETDTDGWEPNA